MNIEKAIENLKMKYEKGIKIVNGRLKGGFVLENSEVNIAINMAIQALEKMEYFRNCKDCACLDYDYDAHPICEKFDRFVDPEHDGCTFYEEWSEE